MIAISISLPDSLKTFVDAEVATKGYGNVSEYFRTLLRDAQGLRHRPGPQEGNRGQRGALRTKGRTGRERVEGTRCGVFRRRA